MIYTIDQTTQQSIPDGWYLVKTTAWPWIAGDVAIVQVENGEIWVPRMDFKESIDPDTSYTFIGPIEMPEEFK